MPVDNQTREAASSLTPEATCRLWIALPAYNEQEAIPKLLEDLAVQCTSSFIDYEINVVDDGSSDDTAAAVLDAATKWNVNLVQHVVNQGLAGAIRTGLQTVIAKASDDDFILTMDSDGTHPVELIPQMLSKAENGTDVVIASRFQPGAKVIGLSAFRHLLSLGARVCFSVALPAKGVRDYTCGYRIYRAEKLREVMEFHGEDFVSEKGFSCMVDILLKMRKHETTFGEVPMVLRYDLKQGDSKMAVSKTIIDTLKLIFRRRFGFLN